MESSIWYEKYAPKTLEEEILPPKVKDKFLKYVKDEKMPNLGFWSSKPGLGKSSTARAIIKSMNADAMFINSSLERGIDVLRTKIMSFASQESLMDRPKIVVMDECLEENEKVIILKDGKEIPTKLNELKPGTVYNCKSFNMHTGKIEDDTCEVVSDKFDDVYDVELEDGRHIKVTSNHPFIVKTQNGTYIQKSIDDGLNENDDIVCR